MINQILPSIALLMGKGPFTLKQIHLTKLVNPNQSRCNDQDINDLHSCILPAHVWRPVSSFQSLWLYHLKKYNLQHCALWTKQSRPWCYSPVTPTHKGRHVHKYTCILIHWIKSIPFIFIAFACFSMTHSMMLMYDVTCNQIKWYENLVVKPITLSWCKMLAGN